MPLDFTAVDVETANRHRGSVCALGAVKVRDGRIVDGFTTLVVPPVAGFEAYNVAVHGIREHDVVHAPRWPRVHDDLMRFIGTDAVAAHNAVFDASVLRQACIACGLDHPQVEFVCTQQLAEQLLPLASHRLPRVAAHLGLGRFRHHDPLQDATTAARVMIALAEAAGAGTVDEVVDGPGGDTWCGTGAPAPAGPAVATNREAGDRLRGHQICFTGTLVQITREEAHDLVAGEGGIAQRTVTRATTMLVSGDLDVRTLAAGSEVSGKTRRARELAAAGQRIELLTEDAFFDRLSPDPAR